MKSSRIRILPALLFLAAFQAMAQQDIRSLRGELDLQQPDPAPEIKSYRKDGDVLPRAYVQQPPLIPHKIDGYQVDKRYNKCMSCHSWKNYRRYNATKISQTHFEDREGNVLATVAPRRYFCTQCHVPQADAQPLVDNLFRPVESLDTRGN